MNEQSNLPDHDQKEDFDTFPTYEDISPASTAPTSPISISSSVNEPGTSNGVKKMSSLALSKKMKKKYNTELDNITLRKPKRRLGKVHIPKHLKDLLNQELDVKKPELLKYQKRYERNIQKIKALYVFLESTMDFLKNPMNLFLHDV
jgi:hypothetical protein